MGIEITGIGESDETVIARMILVKRTVMQDIPRESRLAGSSFAPLALKD
jgi:hypothetical protein